MDESSYIDNPKNTAAIDALGPITNWSDPASRAAFYERRRPVRCQPEDEGAYFVLEIGEQHWYRRP